MRFLVIMLLVMAFGVGLYFVFKGDGMLERVTEQRVEQALIDNRVPLAMSECMAPRLVDRLSINQLMKLERLAAQDGETTIPLSTGGAVARLRRVDDREAVEQLVRVAGGCGFDLMLERL